MFILGCCRSLANTGTALFWMTASVWVSVPVTMLPRHLTNERRVLRLLTNDIPVPEAGRHDLDLPAVQVPHQVGDHPGLNNILRSNNVINKIMSIIINNIS